jgi:hypothetical protein
MFKNIYLNTLFLWGEIVGGLELLQRKNREI